MTKAEFIKVVKDHMRNNKNQWLNQRFIVDGKNVGIKLFNKSIQAMEIDGVRYGGVWEIPTQKQVVEIISNRIEGRGN